MPEAEEEASRAAVAAGADSATSLEKKKTEMWLLFPLSLSLGLPLRK